MNDKRRWIIWINQKIIIKGRYKKNGNVWKIILKDKYSNKIASIIIWLKVEECGSSNKKFRPTYNFLGIILYQFKFFLKIGF